MKNVIAMVECDSFLTFRNMLYQSIIIIGIFILFLLSSISCSDESPTSPENIFGTYTLIKINGSPPPEIIWEQAQIRLEISDGLIIIQEDSWSWEINLHGSFNSELTWNETWYEGGTYSRNRNQIEFQASDDTYITGIFGNSNLIVAVKYIETSGYIEDEISFEIEFQKEK